MSTIACYLVADDLDVGEAVAIEQAAQGFGKRRLCRGIDSAAGVGRVAVLRFVLIAGLRVIQLD